MHFALRLLPRERGDGMGNNAGPPAAAIEGDVRNLQQGCPQLFEIIGEDVASSHGTITRP